MTPVMQSPAPLRTFPSEKVLLDCRKLNFSAGLSLQDSVVAWVMSFPEPSAMHIVLPSSVPDVRRIQCTLQGMGCDVSRVTKLP